MPTNNFKLFDEKKANMMTDEEYAINQQRLNGVQSGVASSQLQNKTLYQVALMCYGLAQLMTANGYDANDADAVSTFVNNLSLSVLQKVVDKASADDVVKQVAGKWVDAKQLGELKTDIADNYLPLLGGTMLGNLILNSDPISSLQAATKQYVDKGIGTGGVNLRGKCGSYIGTGYAWNEINVGFRPSFLIICRGYDAGDHAADYALAIVTQAQLDETINEIQGFMSKIINFTDNGFKVVNGAYNTSTSPQVWLNTQGRVYSYLAII